MYGLILCSLSSEQQTLSPTVCFILSQLGTNTLINKHFQVFDMIGPVHIWWTSINMATELAVETIRSLLIYRGGERLNKGVNQYGQVSFNCLYRLKYSETKQNRPLYNKKLVAPAPKYITIIPYVS